MLQNKPGSRIEVIISAENASASFGGEAILPLQYFTRLKSRGVPVRLVVHERVREELVGSYPQHQNSICYVDDTNLQRLLYKISQYFPETITNFTFTWWISVLTSITQRKMIKEIIDKGFGNIVHQPTPVSPRLPSLMWRLGAPVIIGPLNGGMNYPPAFSHYENWPSKLIMTLGRKVSHLANWLVRGKPDAALILVANQRTKAALPKFNYRNVAILPENGIDSTLWHDAQASRSAQLSTNRFVYIGRLVKWKGIDIIINAVNEIPETTRPHLTIIGDGPELQSLQQLTSQLNVGQWIDFPGFLTQKACAAHLSSSSGLLLPSLRECGGAVILEALSMNKPVIATNWGGATDYLDSTSGILVDPNSREDMIAGFADAMSRLQEDPEYGAILAKNGAARVKRDYDWESKIDQIVSYYTSVFEDNLVQQ